MSKTASFYMKCDDFIKEIFMKYEVNPFSIWLEGLYAALSWSVYTTYPK